MVPLFFIALSVICSARYNTALHFIVSVMLIFFHHWDCKSWWMWYVWRHSVTSCTIILFLTFFPSFHKCRLSEVYIYKMYVWATLIKHKTFCFYLSRGAIMIWHQKQWRGRILASYQPEKGLELDSNPYFWSSAYLPSYLLFRTSVFGKFKNKIYFI